MNPLLEFNRVLDMKLISLTEAHLRQEASHKSTSIEKGFILTVSELYIRDR